MQLNRERLRRILIGDFSARRLVRSLVLIYVLVFGAAWILSDRLIFMPPPPGYADDDTIIKLSTPNGEYVSARYYPVADARYTVLYSHGSGEDLSTVEAQLLASNEHGLSVFAYDYRGYGTSEGRPSERAAYADVQAAYAYLTSTLGVTPDNIVVWGYSIGSGPSVEIATRMPIAGLVLEAPIMGAIRIRTKYRVFPIDRFDNVAKIEDVDVPILVMHSRDDGTVPFRSATVSRYSNTLAARSAPFGPTERVTSGFITRRSIGRR